MLAAQPPAFQQPRRYNLEVPVLPGSGGHVQDAYASDHLVHGMIARAEKHPDTSAQGLDMGLEQPIADRVPREAGKKNPP